MKVMKQQKVVVSFSKLTMILALLGGPFLFWGCDFTPPLYKRVFEAQNYLIEQRYTEAIALYEKILESNPPTDMKVKIFYQLGEVYSINLNDNKNGIKYYKRVKEVSEDPLWLVKVEERIGDINFSFIKNYQASIESYLLLSSFKPRLANYDFYEYRLGQSYLRLGDFVKAEEVFVRIQSQDGHQYHVDSFFEAGLAAFQQKDWRRSVGFLNEYIRREKRRDGIIRAKFLVANAYETMEELKEAYNLYYSLLGEYPNTQVIQNRLNAIYNRRVARRR